MEITTNQLTEAIRRHDNDTVFKLVGRMDLKALNANDRSGNTPLHTAWLSKNQQALDKLVATAGVNLNAADKWGETPLHYAVMMRNIQAVEKLGKIPGVNVNAMDYLNQTPLHLAARYGHHEAVETLGKTRGVNVNAMNIHKQTPLHLAAKFGYHGSVVKLLAIPEINANIRDDEGKTPVMIAASDNDKETLETLVNDERVDIDMECDGQRLEELLSRGPCGTKYHDMIEKRMKRKQDQELTNHYGTNETMEKEAEVTNHGKKVKEKVKCDPDEVRDNLRKHLIENIDQVNEERQILKITINENSEKMENEMQNLNRWFDEEKGKLESRYTAEKTDVEKKYNDDENRVNQEALKDLTKTSNQLADDLKKIAMDPNDVKKLEKARAILECPICMDIMAPPTRIWVCPGSHSLCEACKGSLVRNKCPTCRNKEVNMRALGMEEVARALFE